MSEEHRRGPRPGRAQFRIQSRLLKGRHAWTTEEGTVVIEEQGDTVLVSESLDAATTATLEKEVFAAPRSAEVSSGALIFFLALFLVRQLLPENVAPSPRR